MEEESPQKQKKDSKEGNSPLKTYTRYSGIAVQMVVIILIAVWGGRKLDELSGTESPIFTALLAVLGVIAAIYTSVKDLIR